MLTNIQCFRKEEKVASLVMKTLVLIKLESEQAISGQQLKIKSYYTGGALKPHVFQKNFLVDSLLLRAFLSNATKF